MSTKKARAKLDGSVLKIRRWLGEFEVVDATENLRVFIKPQDIAKATRKDPAACVFAQACIRQLEADVVLFYRSRAFVKLKDSNGVTRIERYVLTPAMRQLVHDFDEGRTVIPDAGFTLQAPSGSRTLEGERKRSERSRNSGRKILGRTTIDGENGGWDEATQRRQPIVRSGVGQVHFNCKKETSQ